MSFTETKDAIAHFKKTWAQCDEDSKYEFFWYVFGLLSMAAAIVSYFGWPGLMWCLGYLIYKVNKNED